VTATYRLRQGLRSLFAFSQQVETPLAAQYLTPELLELFGQMRQSEQLHSLNVLRGVLAQGTTPPELAIAALLHDVGKSRYPLWTWQKTLVVLVRAILPNLYQRWSQGNPANYWVRPFVVYAQHPKWSAEMAAAMSVPEAALWLIARHQEAPGAWANHPYTPLLKRLQAADDAN
jgi:hypothetical protein